MAVRRTKATATPKATAGKRETLTPEERHEQISRRAYELYEQRGRHDGNDLRDWLQAEAEIEADVVSMSAAR
jgi:Protein of unknown function (DUF2934)